MARYTGPSSKIARKFGEAIFGPDKALQRKPYGPGQHGNAKRRSKKSEYAVQLAEKQKLKFIYGVLERQFAKTYSKANRSHGITGENLLKLLESRLDNIVYRFGIAPTRRAARQLVGHAHILVNGGIVNIPSFQVKPGDVVSIREKSKANANIVDALNGKVNRFGWLEWDKANFSGKMLALPEREQIPENVKEQLIVELYSK